MKSIIDRLSEMKAEVLSNRSKMQAMREVVAICEERVQEYLKQALELEDELSRLEKEFEEERVTLDSAYGGGRTIKMN